MYERYRLPISTSTFRIDLESKKVNVHLGRFRVPADLAFRRFEPIVDDVIIMDGVNRTNGLNLRPLRLDVLHALFRGRLRQKAAKTPPNERKLGIFYELKGVVPTRALMAYDHPNGEIGEEIVMRAGFLTVRMPAGPAKGRTNVALLVNDVCGSDYVRTGQEEYRIDVEAERIMLVDEFPLDGAWIQCGKGRYGRVLLRKDTQPYVGPVYFSVGGSLSLSPSRWMTGATFREAWVVEIPESELERVQHGIYMEVEIGKDGRITPRQIPTVPLTRAALQEVSP